MNNFIKNLQFIFKPRYWQKEYQYCPTLDKKINELLDKGVKITNIDGPTADLGDLKNVWISNYPFSYGHLYWQYNYQPSRQTMKKMKLAVAESLLYPAKEGK